ncbi:MAG: type IX secretion system sortase PorU [Bacteroidota bacterium]
MSRISLCLILISGLVNPLMSSGVSPETGTGSRIIRLEWLPVQETSLPDGEMISHHYFRGAVLDDDLLPEFEETTYLPSGISTAEIKIEILETETVSDTRGLPKISLIPSEFTAQNHAVFRKKAGLLSSRLNTIRKRNDGSIERLKSFKLILIPKPGLEPIRSSRTYPRNSIFSSGKWYRIALLNDGIYRLDYGFLKSLGIDVDNIDPRTLQVFGNGGGQLPYLNSATRFDDPAENALLVSGEGDGRFDSGDFALFYGTSQTRWKHDAPTQSFTHQVNGYCDTTYYFISVGRENGKRISSRASSTSTPDYDVSDFNDLAFHEADLYNLLKSGREWYGEKLDNINPSRTFSFTFPNHIASETVRLKINLIGRATNSVGHNNNSFIIKINGAQVAAQGFADVGSSAQDNYALPVTINQNVTITGNTLDLTVQFYSSDPNGIGWLNFIEATTLSPLNLSGRPAHFHFRNASSVGPGKQTKFNLDGITNDHVIWDVTDPTEVVDQLHQKNGTQLSFVAATENLRQFVAFRPSTALTPLPSGMVDNQNLHGLSQAEMVIVTHPSFTSQAEKVASFHRTEGLRVHVVTTRQVFNEFSSAAQDVCAIRNFMKMLYDRSSSPSDMPRYLLLFGDASYDNKYRIADNTNYVTSFQSVGSLNNTQTYMSDDFYGLLDDSEGEWSNSEIVDLAVGRLPVRNTFEAETAVRKILNYGGAYNTSALMNTDQQPLGEWRNMVSFVADDQDNNTHFKQADTLANRVSRGYPVYNLDKIYLDAYNQVSTPGGQRYPDAQRAIVDRVERGTLLMTYIGHGGEVGWGHERILEIADINGWTNFQRLAAFLTATCEFTRIDDPARVSAGEYIFLNPNGGGICLFTTSRLAFSSSNNNLCQRFYTHVFEPFEGRRPTIGEVFEQTKIDVYSDQYVRNFILVGDPALTLAYPEVRIKTTAVNGHNVQSGGLDTLKALARVTITGEVTDNAGARLNDFNGIITPTVYDKWTTYYTLGNDESISSDPSYSQPFRAQRNIIYKGKVSATNGAFTFSFVVPKDIQFQYGFGKISYYAQNGLKDATGYDTLFYVGGFDDTGASDDNGPSVKLFMNDEKFINGSMTDEKPTLLALVSDSSGINAVGSGIGHEMTAILDGDPEKLVVLNDFYQNDLNSYQSGRVSYPYQDLTPGPHNLKFKVWDVYNNSSEATLDFIVAESADLALEHVLNYPNPFTTNTRFIFEHNRPGTNLNAQVQIFTISGKLIKTVSGQIFSEGFRSDELTWDGLDDYGDRIGKGVYLYKLKVRTPEGSSAEKIEKLVILR